MAVDLSFSETGAGAPLIILHGLFGSKRNWSSIARELSLQYRVLAVDLRNHGDSPWDARHDYPALADDVARLIQTAGGGPAHVIGHSMGGKAAMVLALTRPELVDRLVVVDIPPAASSGTSIDYLHALKAVPLAAFTRRSEVLAALAETIPEPAIQAFLAQNVITGPKGLSWAVNLAALERHFDAILGFPDLPPERQFTGPALFIAGGRSEYVQPHHQPEIERLFPAATVEVIAGAGHWVHAEAPGPFLEAVHRFFQR
ncbi:MAG: alpha/beta fold hydrolase [Planctomycetota bacterium]